MSERWIMWEVHPTWTWIRECIGEWGPCVLAYRRDNTKPLRGLQPREVMPGLLEYYEHLLDPYGLEHGY